jgi:predicted O-methyltransferase YrrM
MAWRILQYLKHQLYRRNRKGFGIHSPYLFEFVHDVVFNASRTEVPEQILRCHRSLKRENSLIPLGKLGTTANVEPSGRRTVGSFVRRSSVNEKYGSLLYRVSRWFKPDMIIELGTGLGISALYLGSGAPDVPLHSIEGNTDRADFAAQLMCRCGMGPVSIHWGEMDEKLEDLMPVLEGRFLAFVDGNHHFGPTVRYVEKLLEGAGEEAVIILHDIYWSRDMQRAWEELLGRPGIRVGIDLFQMGILLLRRDLNKMQVKIKF